MYIEENKVASSTATFTGDPLNGYPDDVTQDLIRHVRNAPTEEDALHNIPLILKQYKKTIGWKELILLLIGK